MTFASVAAAVVIAMGTLYPASMEVTAVTADTVTMQTAAGQVYEITNDTDYMVGDLVAVIMCDSNTPEVTDDVIIDTQYSGYFNDGRNLDGPVFDDTKGR